MLQHRHRRMLRRLLQHRSWVRRQLTRSVMIYLRQRLALTGSSARVASAKELLKRVIGAVTTPSTRIHRTAQQPTLLARTATHARAMCTRRSGVSASESWSKYVNVDSSAAV